MAIFGPLAQIRNQISGARFAAALKNRPVILGYYFSSEEGGASSGAAPASISA